MVLFCGFQPVGPAWRISKTQTAEGKDGEKGLELVLMKTIGVFVCACACLCEWCMLVCVVSVYLFVCESVCMWCVYLFVYVYVWVLSVKQSTGRLSLCSGCGFLFMVPVLMMWRQECQTCLKLYDTPPSIEFHPVPIALWRQFNGRSQASSCKKKLVELIGKGIEVLEASCDIFSLLWTMPDNIQMKLTEHLKIALIC